MAARQLDQLNAEIAVLCAKADAVEKKWLAATDPQERAALRELYTDTRFERRQVDARRAALEAALLETGWFRNEMWDKGGHSDELGRFLLALPAQEDAIKGLMPGSVIELEGEAIWLNGPFGSNALFVRKVYPELIAARDDLVQERGWPQSDFETVFTGTPGIDAETRLSMFTWPCARFASERLRLQATTSLQPDQMADIALTCIKDGVPSTIQYWWETLYLQYLQRGVDDLPAALLLDGMEKAIELKLTLPAAPIEYLASLEEATTHCKSGVSILLIPQGALARRVIVRIPFEEILGKNKRNWESALYFQERVEKLFIPEDPVESVVAAMDIGESSS
ncbi:g10312 [Coccomyxa viridis]|uniref:G10312 protein n=1 Tax=Coccomyxa viridis TaxID=1274662 RepID=A0ABP1G6E8_9CHLO